MNQKRQFIKWLSWVPAVMMMMIIFMFSAKPAVASDATSTPIAEIIVRVYEAVFGKIDASSRFNVLDTMNFIVRKTAHITEYALLAVSISLGFETLQMEDKKRFLYSVILSVLYAATDEYHQTFIQGRSGSIKDVGIDSIGILLGSFLFVLIVRHIRKKKKQTVN